MKLQLHATALDMLSKCGEQFRRRYIEGEKQPPGVAMLIGTATDAAVSRNLESKIATDALLDAEAVKDAARDAVEGEWMKGIRLEDEYVNMGLAKARGIATDTTVTLASLHHRDLAPSLAPTHVHRPWVLDIEGEDMQLAGDIDIQEAGRIRDTKTSSKSPNAEAANRSVQLTTYSLAVQQHDGTLPESVHLDYLVNTKMPKVVALQSTRDQGDIDALLRRVERAVEVIKRGAFMPAAGDPSAWWCSPKFCGFYATCPFVRMPKAVQVQGFGGNGGNGDA